MDNLWRAVDSLGRGVWVGGQKVKEVAERSKVFNGKQADFAWSCGVIGSKATSLI